MEGSDAAKASQFRRTANSEHVITQAACMDWNSPAQKYFRAGDGKKADGFDVKIQAMCNPYFQGNAPPSTITFKEICSSAKAAMGVEQAEKVATLSKDIILDRFMRHAMRSVEKPVALIMLGPPASGKSRGSVGKSIQQLSPAFVQDEMQHIVFAEDTIDDVMDLVEPYHQEVLYRQDVRELVKEMRSLERLPKLVDGRVSELPVDLSGMEDSSPVRDRSALRAMRTNLVRDMDVYLGELTKTMFGGSSENGTQRYLEYKASEYNKFRTDSYVDDVNNGAMATALALKIPFMYETTFAKMYADTGKDWAMAIDVPKMRMAGFRIEGYMPVTPPEVLITRALQRSKESGRMPPESQIRGDVNECGKNVFGALSKSKTGEGFDALTLITRYREFKEGGPSQINRGEKGDVLLQWDGAQHCFIVCETPQMFADYGLSMLADICGAHPMCA